MCRLQSPLRVSVRTPDSLEGTQKHQAPLLVKSNTQPRLTTRQNAQSPLLAMHELSRAQHSALNSQSTVLSDHVFGELSTHPSALAEQCSLLLSTVLSTEIAQCLPL